MDRAARSGRHRRRPELFRLQPAEPARREAGAAAHAGVHRPRARRPPRRRRPRSRPARPPGTIVNPPTFQQQPAVIQPTITVQTHAGAARRRQQAAGGAAPRRRGPRRRPQHPGRRRQGQQHAADRRHGAGVPHHRSGAEEARRPAAAGRDRGHHRVGCADRRPRLRRRLAVQGRRAVGPRLGRQRERGIVAVQPGGPAGRCRRDRGRQPGAGARAGLLLHHQQREFPRRRAGGAAPARSHTATRR